MKFFVADDMATGADGLDRVLWYHRLPTDESGIKYPVTRHNNLIYPLLTIPMADPHRLVIRYGDLDNRRKRKN
jgi:hypothetical protein